MVAFSFQKYLKEKFAKFKFQSLTIGEKFAKIKWAEISLHSVYLKKKKMKYYM